MPQVSLVRVSAVIGLLAFVSTCDDPDSRVPTSPDDPSVTNLQIAGPDTIAPGQSVQFNAVTRLSDGTTKIANNVSGLRWQSFEPSVLVVSPSGVVTGGQQRGEADVSADLIFSPGGRRATKEVVVVPDGTYRMVGMVAEVEYPTAYIDGARVEINPGSLVATTDHGGQYRLYGVPPDAEVRVTAPGYQSYMERLQLSGHTARNFLLPLTGRRLTLTGDYTLAIDVVGACGGSPPLRADLRRRSYEAVSTQNGANVVVTLTEPRFGSGDSSRGNSFRGRADAASAQFTLAPFADYYYYFYGKAYPDVAEQLPDGTYLVPSGTTSVTGSSDRVSGDLYGSISNWDSRFPENNSSLIGVCDGRFRFTLTRR